MAERVRLQRQRGWKMPPNTMKVDRTTKFGNPFSVEQYGRAKAADLHRMWLLGELRDEDIRAQYSGIIAQHLIARRQAVLSALNLLHGKNLACWCDEGPCHADTLLELAATEARFLVAV